MRELIKKYDAPFLLSSISRQDVTDKVAFDNSPLLEDTLNQYIQLSNYGEGVKSIGFIFLAVPPNNTLHEQVVEYTRKDKKVFMQLKLPYEQVIQSDKQQVLQLMATTYLHANEHFLNQLHIPNFDSQCFQQDLRQLFESKGWLIEVPIE